jgi:hypothetical protein
MAVAALVLGIAGIVLCFIFIPSLLALIFGLVAAKRIRQSNGALTGTGLARAGWILGLIGLVIGASFVTAAVLGAFDDDDVALSDLEVGMCANLADLEGEVSSVPTVDCTEPHDAELTFIGQLNADGVAEYPGVSEVRATVEQECAGESFTDYVGANYDDSEFDIIRRLGVRHQLRVPQRGGMGSRGRRVHLLPFHPPRPRPHLVGARERPVDRASVEPVGRAGESGTLAATRASVASGACSASCCRRVPSRRRRSTSSKRPIST